jgi:hypothetical protein
LNLAARRVALGALVTSLVALALAPLLMPADYSVITHSVSESAAQGVEGAWLARAGLVLFGVGVIILSIRPPTLWSRWARLAHIGFAISIMATAVFSHAPWDGSPHNSFEDFLHSAASFGVGMTFMIGVALVLLNRRDAPSRVFDLVALAAALAIPLLMPRVEAAGLAQRAMFLIAFLWYGKEAMWASTGMTGERPLVSWHPA